LFASAIAILAIIYDLGFEKHPGENRLLEHIYIWSVIIGFISIAGRYFYKKIRPVVKALVFDLPLILLCAAIILLYFDIINLAKNYISIRDIWLRITVAFILLREFSALKVNFKWGTINPAQLFIISFLTLIVSGCFFLLLPNATYTNISLIDALFTSTSAVCVTGLIVVDTGSFFTPLGQIIIIFLIQAGGLGIMTFASYFSYFFKGSASFSKQILISELTWSGRLGEVFATLKKIIITTFFIEIAGAVLIFYCIDKELINSYSERLFFSVFHSVSGFCNAGFSTLQENLFSSAFRFNYSLHLVVAVLFVLGGMGFPIVFNLFKYLKNKLLNQAWKLAGRKHSYSPWIVNINTRIVLITTLCLILFGTVSFFIFEYNNTLAEHNLWGKVVASFFGAVTPRTAGFNTTDTANLSMPVVMMMFFLMWVGASPASTGGGIKTSTLALAVLNFLTVARGKKRMEVFGREISQTSINRAFAVIFLSILVITTATFSILLFENDLNALDVTFECVSAFSTVGLSRGITADLNNYSKFVLILTMFIGRVGMLTVLIALFKKVAGYKYRYPEEDVLIN
jgi:trk system potassium uptake protein